MGSDVAQGGEAVLERLRREAAGCTRCELYLQATKTVFGEGCVDSSVMLVGEQPGDREDRAGHPFVGPAGKVLDDALDRAEIDRATPYVTNAVKHFRNDPRGKKRIHRKPALAHVHECEAWLTGEIDAVPRGDRRARRDRGPGAAPALRPRHSRPRPPLPGARRHADPGDRASVLDPAVAGARGPGEQLDALVRDLRVVHTALADR